MWLIYLLFEGKLQHIQVTGQQSNFIWKDALRKHLLEISLVVQISESNLDSFYAFLQFHLIDMISCLKLSLFFISIDIFWLIKLIPFIEEMLIPFIPQIYWATLLKVFVFSGTEDFSSAKTVVNRHFSQ